MLSPAVSPQSYSSRRPSGQWLHCLPIIRSINFRIADVTPPPALCILPSPFTYVHPCMPGFLLVPSDSAPFVSASFGARSFSVAAHKVWNSLPPSLRTCTSPDTFRTHLMTHYCQQAFQPSQPIFTAPQIRLLLSNVRVYKLYLLAY